MSQWDRDCEGCGRMMPDCICGERRMDDLADALDYFEQEWQVAGRPYLWDASKAIKYRPVLLAAARRMAEAGEIWWCETHRHQGSASSCCFHSMKRMGDVYASAEGEEWRVSDNTCRMIRRPLLKPEQA